MSSIFNPSMRVTQEILVQQEEQEEQEEQEDEAGDPLGDTTNDEPIEASRSS